jgi:hypothetical protein
MALFESYLRIRLNDPNNADDFQAYLGTLPGYIGSYTVEVKPIGSSNAWTFDIAVGYRQEPPDLDVTVATIRDRVDDVEEVRELRNQQPYSGGEQGEGAQG